jgi:ubiquinone/menaquinone biosynthesis C-methylase UbiE
MSERIIISKQMIEDTFDGAAPLYDKGRAFRDSGQRLVNYLPIKSGDNILDIATGTGAVLIPAAHRTGPKGRVTGIDISDNMLYQARLEAEKDGLNNIDLLKMDAEHLEFSDASFDVLTCAFAIFYFPRTALAEMYRVCKLGGVIGLAVFDKLSPDPTNPGVIVNQLINEYGKRDPDAAYIRLKYAWPTRFSTGEMETLLLNYGFHDIKTLSETRDTIYQDGEEFWDMLWSGGSRLTMNNMNLTTRIHFKEDLLNRLMGIMQGDGIHFIETAIYLVAYK